MQCIILEIGIHHPGTLLGTQGACQISEKASSLSDVDKLFTRHLLISHMISSTKESFLVPQSIHSIVYTMQYRRYYHRLINAIKQTKSGVYAAYTPHTPKVPMNAVKQSRVEQIQLPSPLEKTQQFVESNGPNILIAFKVLVALNDRIALIVNFHYFFRR